MPSRRKVHVWKRYRDRKEMAWCRREIRPDDPKGPDGISPMSRSLEGATCIECVEAVQAAALWRLKDDGRVAFEATELLEKLRRRRRRRG